MTNKQKGIMFILISAFSFALMNLFVQLAGDINPIQKSFFRNLISFLFAASILLKDRDFSFQKRNLKYLILRSALGTIGILCNYYALGHLLLSDASMLNKLSPFVVLICSYIFLKEKMNGIQVFSIIVAFIGSLFIIRPGFSLTDMLPALVGLAGAIAAGGAYTTVRYLGLRGERGPFIVFFFSAFSCIAVLPYIILNFEPMTLKQLGMLLLAGLAASGGQFGVTYAYKYAPASDISIYDYTQVIFAAVLGFVVFGQVPDGMSIVGYVLICGVSVLMYLYNMGYLKIRKEKTHHEQD
ncbi:DMT family transporter [Frisingicoccus sp.]|uniref:DMT family transporter n=1 Tax=Frisingicoccus sp. TaxID=1918627 RepID=UPI002E9C26C0|nr:DMT family transporter [Frisingicoccus sp.]